MDVNYENNVNVNKIVWVVYQQELLYALRLILLVNFVGLKTPNIQKYFLKAFIILKYFY